MESLWKKEPGRRAATCSLQDVRTDQQGRIDRLADFNSGLFSNPARNRPATTSSTSSLDDEACFAGSTSNCATDLQSLVKCPIPPHLEHLTFLLGSSFLVHSDCWLHCLSHQACSSNLASCMSFVRKCNVKKSKVTKRMQNKMINVTMKNVKTETWQKLQKWSC